MKTGHKLVVSIILIVSVVVALFLFAIKPQHNVSSEHSRSRFVDTEISNDKESLIDNNERLSDKDQTVFHKKEMNYDDAWCDAKFDLNEKSMARVETELKELGLAHGDYRLSSNNYIGPYKDLDFETLKFYVENDDKLAMIALIQRDDELLFKSARESLSAGDVVDKAALRKQFSDNGKFLDETITRLVVLGDLSYGLSYLTLQTLSKAQERFNKKGRADDVVVNKLLEALTLIDYGLEFGSTSGLHSYLSFFNTERLSSNQEVTNDLSSAPKFNPDVILTEADLNSVSSITAAFKQELNKKRASLLLEPIEEIYDDVSPKITSYAINTSLTGMVVLYGEPAIFESRVLNLWQDSYLRKDTCKEQIFKHAGTSIARSKVISHRNK